MAPEPAAEIDWDSIAERTAGKFRPASGRLLWSADYEIGTAKGKPPNPPKRSRSPGDPHKSAAAIANISTKARNFLMPSPGFAFSDSQSCAASVATASLRYRAIH